MGGEEAYDPSSIYLFGKLTSKDGEEGEDRRRLI